MQDKTELKSQFAMDIGHPAQTQRFCKNSNAVKHIAMVIGH